MTMTSIADALKTAPGTLLDGCRGVIKLVGEHNAGVYNPPGGGAAEPYSLQTIIVTGKDGDEIAAEIAHHDKIDPDKVGKFIWLLAHQKSTGGKSGLKVVDVDGRPMLRVTKSAEVVFSAPGSAVPQPTLPTEGRSTGALFLSVPGQQPVGAASVGSLSPSRPVETGLGTPGATQTGAAEIGSVKSWTSPLETEGRAKEKSAPLDASVSTAKIDEMVALYKLIRKRVVNGVGEQLPDQDCVDRATKTIFDSMILSGPF